MNQAIVHEIHETKIVFLPVSAPPYTHRVLIDGNWKGVEWLRGEYDPRKQATARYYYEKYVRGCERPDLLARARRRKGEPKPWTVAGFAAWCLEHEYEVIGKVGPHAYRDLPFERYQQQMYAADTWKSGSFRRLDHGDVYKSTARWMDRFNSFCRARMLDDEVQGWQVHMWLMRRKEWDTKEYDDRPSMPF